MSSEEANDQRSIAKEVGGIHFDVILIEQAELRSTVSDFQRVIRKPRSFELCGGPMHRFDGFMRRVIRWSS